MSSSSQTTGAPAQIPPAQTSAAVQGWRPWPWRPGSSAGGACAANQLSASNGAAKCVRWDTVSHLGWSGPSTRVNGLRRRSGAGLVCIELPSGCRLAWSGEDDPPIHPAVLHRSCVSCADDEPPPTRFLGVESDGGAGDDGSATHGGHVLRPGIAGRARSPASWPEALPSPSWRAASGPPVCPSASGPEAEARSSRASDGPRRTRRTRDAGSSWATESEPPSAR